MPLSALVQGHSRFSQFASPAHVLDTVRLSPHVALIRMRVPPSFVAFEPGDKVKIAVPGGRPKSYTPARLSASVLEIVFDLHGKGPTAQWAENTRPGDALRTTQALPSLKVPTGPLWFVGDATTLGLAVALHQDPRYRLTGVVELAAEDAEAISRLDLPLRAVLPGHASTTAPGEAEIAVIAGEAGLVSDSFRTMRAAGIPRVCSKPYWSLRGRAHRKAVAMATGGAR